jgi:hypothetical protein
MISQEKINLRKQMIEYFRSVAIKDGRNNEQQVTIDQLLDKDDNGKRVLFIIPEALGDVFLTTSLFKSLKEQYPWANLYVATKPENFDILLGNKYVHKIIPYHPQMDNQPFLEGIGNHLGWFEVTLHPYFGTQRMLDYLNNGKTKLNLDLKY